MDLSVSARFARHRGMGLFVLLSAIWGSSFAFVAIALRHVAPSLLVTARMGLAAATLGLVVAVGRFPLPRDPRSYLGLGLVTVANVTVPFNLLAWSQQFVPSSLASVLSSTVPVFVFLFSSVILRRERLTSRRVLGTGLAILGVRYVVDNGGAGTGEQVMVGSVGILLSSAIFAMGQLLAQRSMARWTTPPVVAAWIQSTFAAVLQIPIVMAVSPDIVPSRLNGQAAFAILWLGILGSGVAYLLYFTLIHEWGPTRASMNTYFQPAVGLVLGVGALGEVLRVQHVLGVALILGGVALFASERLRSTNGWIGHKDEAVRTSRTLR